MPKPQPLQHVQPDAAEAEHDGLGALLDLGGIDDSSNAGRDAAADVANLVERRVFADFRHRDFRQHGVVRKGRGAHVVVHRLAAKREARGAVRHQALSLGGADRGAEIGLARQAGGTLPAFRRVKRNNVIAFLHAGHATSDIDHDARALMAENGRKQPLGISARQREFVGVANAGRFDLDQNFAVTGSIELNGGDFQRLTSFNGDGGTNFHDVPLGLWRAMSYRASGAVQIVIVA
jgi:hypothetical protein